MSNKYFNKIILIAVVFVCIFSFAFINAQENNIKAFPGAEGFGAYAKGGRGGAVCKVTNLNDSGSGSLRYCLEDQSGPRIVIFNVSGTIELNSRIFMSGENDSYVTVAGQTAPGNGIQLKNYGIGILGGTHDVVIRYIKIRPGVTGSADGSATDGFLIMGSDQYGLNHTYNIMIDHVSVEWGIDEVVGFWDWVTDATIQNSIIAEGTLTGHPEGNHSYNMLNGHNSNNNAEIEVSIYKNLFAHSKTRNPRLDYGVYDFRNNIVYNWADLLIGIFASGAHVNFINNHYIAGPGFNNDTRNFSASGPGTKVYVNGNWTPLCPNGCSDDWNIGWFNTGTEYKSDTEFSVPEITTLSTSQVKSLVLADVGANRCNGDMVANCQDTVDSRIINEVNTKTGRVGPFSISLPVGWPESFIARSPSFGFVNAFTANTLTDLTSTGVAGKIDDWPLDGFSGKYVKITSGTGKGQIHAIISNDKDTLTIDSDWSSNLEPSIDLPGGGDHPYSASHYEIRDTADSWDWWPIFASQSPASDNDGDGMPDSWEIKYGLNPNTADGNSDIDNDGYTNIEEYLNGTEPAPLICATGDLDCDQSLNISDIQIAINVFLGTDTDADHRTRADVNGNGQADIADIQKVVNIIFGI